MVDLSTVSPEILEKLGFSIDDDGNVVVSASKVDDLIAQEETRQITTKRNKAAASAKSILAKRNPVEYRELYFAECEKEGVEPGKIRD